VRQLARETRPIAEADLRNLHRLVMLRSDPDNGGQYATGVRFVNTDAGRHVFPTPAEIPARMGDFARWLAAAPMTPETAFRAHREFVSIHPFADGNGRTGRLVMNLVLIRAGYPPVTVRPEDRAAYLNALQQADEGQSAAFDRLLYRRLDATLAEYVGAARQATGDKPAP
jgi:Fic family protein